MDSEASQHITNDLDNFVDNEDIDPESVHLMDDRVSFVNEEGSVCLNLSLPGDNGETITRVSWPGIIFTSLRQLSVCCCVFGWRVW